MTQLKRSLTTVNLMQWLLLTLPWLLMQFGGYALLNCSRGSFLMQRVLAWSVLGSLLLLALLYWGVLVRFVNRLCVEAGFEGEFCGIFSCWHLWSVLSEGVAKYAPGYVSALYISYASLPLAILAGVFHLWGTMIFLLFLWAATGCLVRSALVRSVTESETAMARPVKLLIFVLIVASVGIWGWSFSRASALEKTYNAVLTESEKEPPVREMKADDDPAAFSSAVRIPEFPGALADLADASWQEALKMGDAAGRYVAAEEYLFAQAGELPRLRRLLMNDFPAPEMLTACFRMERLRMLSAAAAGDYRGVRESWEFLAQFRDRAVIFGEAGFRAESERVRILERLVNEFGLGSDADIRIFANGLVKGDEKLHEGLSAALRNEITRRGMSEERPGCWSPLGKECWGVIPELKAACYGSGLARQQGVLLLLGALDDYGKLADAKAFIGALPYGAANEKQMLENYAGILEGYWNLRRESSAMRALLFFEREMRTRGGIPEDLSKSPPDPFSGRPFPLKESAGEDGSRLLEVGGFLLKIR